MPNILVSNFSIRPIAPEDNPVVAAIIRTVMTEFGAVGPGYSIEDPELSHMYEAYRTPHSAFFVLEKSGVAVGCGGVAHLNDADPDVCELRKMYFLPEARGQGQGRRMVTFLEAEARRLEFTYMYLETIETMAQAQILYKKMGFDLLPGPMGNTGHTSCGLFYGKKLQLGVQNFGNEGQ